jgi:hypothetical protein
MKNMALLTAIGRLLPVCLVVLSVSIAANGVSANEELIDPKASNLFKQMSDALGRAQSLQFKAYALYDDFEKSGVKYKRGLVQEVTLRRPDRLHFRTTTDEGIVREGWYDGKTLTVAEPNRKVYGQIDAPASLDELLDLLQDTYNVQVPTVDLLYSDLFGRLKEHLLSAVYIGERRVDATLLDHLSLETTPADVQLWLEKGDVPVPRRMVIDLVSVDGEPEYLVLFRDWFLGHFVNDGEFRFAPPADWTKVEIPKQGIHDGAKQP